MNTLFPTNAASFEEPISMLLACHDKVKRFCRMLNALPEHLAQHTVDDATAQSLVQIRRYFSQAAPLHHQDEEADFFPLLLQYCPEAATDVAFLQSQHTILHQTWAALNAELAQLLSGSLKQADAALITRYTRFYAQHIAIEEPWFERGLVAIPTPQLAAAGRRMAARRQQP